MWWPLLIQGSKIKAETIILGRPLADPPPSDVRVKQVAAAGAVATQAPQLSSFALLFLNNKQTTQTFACNSSCLGRLNVSAGTSFTVTNIVTGAPHSTPDILMLGARGAAAVVSATVPGYGASVYLRLDPKN